MTASITRGLIILNLLLFPVTIHHDPAGSTRPGAVQSTARAGAQRPSLFKKIFRRPSPLESFIGTVKNGQAGTLAGIFISPEVSFPVMQQPADNPVYVYEQPRVVTQYKLANLFGTIGILAHNTLAGSAFLKLRLTQPITLVYGDGKARQYQVSTIRRYQALDPTNPYSDFVDLDQPGTKLSSADLFNRIYTRRDVVVFQTCLEKEGNPSWGRIFVTASPTRIQAEVPAVSTKLSYAQ